MVRSTANKTSKSKKRKYASQPRGAKLRQPDADSIIQLPVVDLPATMLEDDNKPIVSARMSFFSARVHTTDVGGRVREPTKIKPQRLRNEDSKRSMSASSKTRLPDLPSPAELAYLSQFVPTGAKFLLPTRRPTGSPPPSMLNMDLGRLRNMQYITEKDQDLAEADNQFNTVIEQEEEEPEPVPESDSDGGVEPNSIDRDQI